MMLVMGVMTDENSKTAIGHKALVAQRANTIQPQTRVQHQQTQTAQQEPQQKARRPYKPAPKQYMRVKPQPFVWRGGGRQWT
jgi:hypothetical protein